MCAVDVAHEAEPVDDLVGHERGVGRAHLGVVEVVVPLAVADVRRQLLGQVLARVLVHEVDDVVGDEGREPAGPVAAVGEVADVGRCRGHDLDAAGVAAGLARRRAHLGHEPADEVRVADLEHRAVRDPPGQLEGHGAVARDPDREPVAAGPAELEHRPLELDRATLDESADHVDRRLEILHRRRSLAQHAPRRVAAADAQVHAPAGDFVQDGERGRGDRGLASGRVRDARPEPERGRRLGDERQRRVRVGPQHVAVEQPAVREPRRLCLRRECERPLDRVFRLEREPELHARSPVRSPRNQAARLPSSLAAEPRGIITEIRRSSIGRVTRGSAPLPRRQGRTRSSYWSGRRSR